MLPLLDRMLATCGAASLVVKGRWSLFADQVRSFMPGRAGSAQRQWSIGK
jgi:hypothetical protein